MQRKRMLDIEISMYRFHSILIFFLLLFHVGIFASRVEIHFHSSIDGYMPMNIWSSLHRNRMKNGKKKTNFFYLVLAFFFLHFSIHCECVSVWLWIWLRADNGCLTCMCMCRACKCRIVTLKGLFYFNSFFSIFVAFFPCDRNVMEWIRWIFFNEITMQSRKSASECDINTMTLNFNEAHVINQQLAEMNVWLVYICCYTGALYVLYMVLLLLLLWLLHVSDESFPSNMVFAPGI